MRERKAFGRSLEKLKLEERGIGIEREEEIILQRPREESFRRKTLNFDIEIFQSTYKFNR